jgi:foldase protein PrsA
MKLSRVTLAVLGIALVLGATACGGSSSGLPAGAVAVVNGTAIPRADLDALIARARKGYAAQKQSFPKEGTQEFQSAQALYLNFLVQKAEFEQQAKDLHVTVTGKDVDKALASFLKTRYPGKKKAQFQKDLKAQGLTLSTFRDTLRVSVLSQKIFDVVTKDVKVDPQEVLAYYEQNSSSYGSAESRDVRHILIAAKDKNGQVDFAKSKAEADRIRSQVTSSNFAALAKKYSADTGSKDSGGKLTDTKGNFVPEFEAVAFKLKTGEISQPVKSTYGYHIIQALAPVKPANRTPFTQVRASIRATLLQSKRNQAMTQWVQDLTTRYKSKVKYAAGFAPPAVPTTDTTTTTQ